MGIKGSQTLDTGVKRVKTYFFAFSPPLSIYSCIQQELYSWKILFSFYKTNFARIWQTAGWYTFLLPLTCVCLYFVFQVEIYLTIMLWWDTGWGIEMKFSRLRLETYIGSRAITWNIYRGSRSERWEVIDIWHFLSWNKVQSTIGKMMCSNKLELLWLCFKDFGQKLNQIHIRKYSLLCTFFRDNN